MPQSRQFAYGLLVASSALLLSGCFKRSATVDENGDSVTVNTDDGSATVSSSASLPAGFPSTVPAPTVGSITSSYSGSDATNAGYTVTYALAAADAATASATYQEQLKAAGFTIEGSATTDAGGSKLDVFSAKNDTIQVGVTITHDADGTATMNLAVTTGNAQ